MPGRLPASDYEKCSPARLRYKPMPCSSRVKEPVEQPTQPSAVQHRTTQVYKKAEGTRLRPTLPTLAHNRRRGLPPFEMNPLLRANLDPWRPVKRVRGDRVHALADCSCCQRPAVVRRRP